MKPLRKKMLSAGKHAYVFNHRDAYTKKINMITPIMRGGIRL